MLNTVEHIIYIYNYIVSDSTDRILTTLSNSFPFLPPFVQWEA